MTSTEIQNMMIVGKSALSNRLKKMENNGYVKFVPSSEDQRVKYVEITAEGKASHERHTRLVNEYVSELLQDINEEEVEQFIQTFHKIRSILQKGGQQR
jgi:DNA-binding MarR family transcriptional regulator